MDRDSRPILVLGATGYVGGRLVPRLLDAGYRVRALVRSLAKLGCRPWTRHPQLEMVQGDVMDLASLRRGAQGCRAAYYLVHSMTSAKNHFVENDRLAALHMAAAAASAGLERIIHLGGLGSDEDPSLSKHLRSRHEVARILQQGPVPTTVLRAAMILGSGSASFELLRYLVDRLPVMLAPQWVRTQVQPIAIRNVLYYLQGCLENPEAAGQTFDIGGPDILSYGDLIGLYAEVAGLPRRILIPLPFLTPWLSALWIHLITPIPSSIARPLSEGLRNRVVCQDNRIRSIIPQELLDCRETIRRALERIEQQRIETCWTDAGTILPPEWTYCGDAQYAGGTILECGYRMRIEATREEVWKLVSSIGGRTGWYFGNTLWGLRGWMDRLAGGTSLERGRRHPSELYVGDALDFWRVLEIEPPHRLLLLSEMKMPGEAVLEFKITPKGPGETEIRQLSRFLPKGLAGMIYWYGLYPTHQLIFDGMLRNLAKRLGKTILSGPERFTPAVPNGCAVNGAAD